jgi:hypothetical protein
MQNDASIHILLVYIRMPQFEKKIPMKWAKGWEIGQKMGLEIG